MKSPANKNTPPPSGKISAAWAPFAKKLAASLGRLDEDQCLVLSLKGGSRFVQFAAQGSFGMRVETTSNSFLPKAEQINARQIEALKDSGWNVPTGDASEATPERDPDGSPNFFVDYSAPVPLESVAELVVKTLTENLRVPHPGFLEYEAFDFSGASLALPDLGLKLATRDSPSDSREAVSAALLETLRATTGIDDLAFDAEGDVGIRFGTALTLARLVDEPPYVRFFSPVLRDLEETPELFARLNDINANKTLLHFVFRNDTIYCIADVSAQPLVAHHVTQALTNFCAIADAMGPLLQEEFGGQIAFNEVIPSLTRH